jgi:carboxymethylenebutenolidase
MADTNGTNGTNGISQTNGTNGTNGTHGHNSAPDYPPEPLPEVKLSEITNGVSLLEPLSRRGHGPGLIILPHESISEQQQLAIEEGVPSPMIKWAEEGYAVVEIRQEALGQPKEALATALNALKDCSSCDHTDAVGLVGT